MVPQKSEFSFVTGLIDMDPRKFLRMVFLGMDKEVVNHPWVCMGLHFIQPGTGRCEMQFLRQ